PSDSTDFSLSRRKRAWVRGLSPASGRRLRTSGIRNTLRRALFHGDTMTFSRYPRFLALLLIPGALLASGSAVRPFHEEPLGEILQDPIAQAALASMPAPATCQDGTALGAFPCRGIDLESYVSLDRMLADTVLPGTAPDPAGSALWGFQSKNDGREYAAFGTT